MNSDSRFLSPSLPQRLLIQLGMCLLLMIPVGCGYPKVSPETYALAKALYSATNRQNIEQIERAEELIAELTRDGRISAAEEKWLRQIVAEAKSGQWERGMLQARQIMQDQAGRPR